MVKARHGQKIREVIGVAKTYNKNNDLSKLKEDYENISKKLKGLVVALQNHNVAAIAMQKSQLDLAKYVGAMSNNSPLFTCTGKQDSQDDGPACSYLSIHEGLAVKADNFSSKFAQHILSYAIEWDKILDERIQVGLKKTEGLRLDLDHYQKKVETLRTAMNIAMAKGKVPQQKDRERLARNEEKLIASKASFDKISHDMCILIEEVTVRSWRDLHPLMVKLIQYDITEAADRSKRLSDLSQIVKVYKEIATKNGINPQARLKDLAGLSPNLLTTRTDDSSTGAQMIENGGVVSPAPLGSSIKPEDEYSLPPGSVAPQGMGGFPVRVQSADLDDYSLPPGSVAPQGLGGFPVRVKSDSVDSYVAPTLDGSTTSNHGGNSSYVAPAIPELSEEIRVRSAAAPPPTLDQINQITPKMQSLSTGTAPSHGNDTGGYNNYNSYGGDGGGGGGGMSSHYQQGGHASSSSPYDPPSLGPPQPPPQAPPPPIPNSLPYSTNYSPPPSSNYASPPPSYGDGGGGMGMHHPPPAATYNQYNSNSHNGGSRDMNHQYGGPSPHQSNPNALVSNNSGMHNQYGRPPHHQSNTNALARSNSGMQHQYGNPSPPSSGNPFDNGLPPPQQNPNPYNSYPPQQQQQAPPSYGQSTY